MIEEKIYKCSFCGRAFLDRVMCEEHEKKHVKPAGIIKTEYVSFEGKSDCYPHTIYIKMNDGVTVIYRYSTLAKQKGE